ncbi:MAG TPA: PQQ-binding-like beta-propeller repeat protein, partial [Pseudohongiella sp.]|nr:PQQ-binding-like beta-propeller repeat protein [Pseudohongiella sp.]
MRTLNWLVFLGAISTAQAQSIHPLLERMTSVSDAMLADPPAADWLNWRRTYDAYGFSPLDQINRNNVSQLREVYRIPLEAGSNTPTPLVHDGVMFLLANDDTLLAMDASSGETLWTFKHNTHPDALPSAKVGIALHGDKIIMPTNDLHVLAINARTGTLIWDTAVEKVRLGRRGHQLHATPLIANGMVVQGVTATMVPEGGFMVGLDLETGGENWRFYAIPRPGEPGDETWNGLELSARSGGSIWMPPSYDTELDLVYFGTAPTYDTASLYQRTNLPGLNNDALYTNSTVALRPRTGEVIWHYQHVANDQWDLDWTFERQIMHLPVNGQMRKVIVTAGKMALFDALDAATGQYLFSLDLGLQNLVTSIDPVTGTKTMGPNAAPIAESAQLVCPFAAGGRNWQASSYNASNKILYLPIAQMCMMGGALGGRSILSTGAALDPVPFP